jgi:uncharacterized protein
VRARPRLDRAARLSVLEVERANTRPDRAVTSCHARNESIREAAMGAQAFAREVSHDGVDLEALDAFLRSDRAPPNSMMLSELDGFLTGIAVGPELVRPSEWLPLVWGGGAPEVADLDDANVLLGMVAARYNEILSEVANDTLAPVFWVDSNEKLLAADWAEGFSEAIRLNMDAWKPLFLSERDLELVLPILSLCRDKDGNCLTGLSPEAADRIFDQVHELIPSCVLRIADYWRRRRGKGISSLLDAQQWSEPRRAPKVGRNDPCPCGSGNKFKRCCGRAA